MAFLHLAKVLRDVFEDKCQIWTRFIEAKFLKVDVNGLHDLYDVSIPVIMKVKNNSTVDRDYSKITKTKRPRGLVPGTGVSLQSCIVSLYMKSTQINVD